MSNKNVESLMNNGMNEETDGYLHYHLKSVSCSHKVTNTNGDSCVCEHFTQVEFVSVMFIHSAANFLSADPKVKIVDSN